MLKSYLLGPEAQKNGHVSLNRQAKTKPSKARSLKPSGEGSQVTLKKKHETLQMKTEQKDHTELETNECIYLHFPPNS